MTASSPPEEGATLPPVVRWGTRYAGLLFFLALAWVPIVNGSRWGDLADWYTDHLHHPFATWVALFHGLEIYTRPFSEIREGTGWPYYTEAWGPMPGFVYPPGVMVLFLPLTLVGRLAGAAGLSFHAFAVVSVIYMLALAAWALHQAIQAMMLLPRGSRVATLGITSLILMQLGLQGFFDSAFLGAGFAAIRAWRRNKPDVALLWLAASAFLHFRAAIFAPLAVVALLQCWKERSRIRLFVPKLAVAAGAVLLSLGAFALMYPATEAIRMSAPRVVSAANVAGVVAVVSLALAGVLSWSRQWLALAAQGIVVALVFVELQSAWWHGAIVLAVPYFIGVLREESFRGELALTRGAALLWALAIHPVVWRDHPGQIFVEFARILRLG
jgi:hypothetical protein